MDFAIVVDSTCDFAPEELSELGVAMVPLTISVGGRDYRDQEEVSNEEFYRLMSESETLPQTSQPSPFSFVRAYRKLADEGYRNIMSIHLASPLSGTIGSVTSAAAESEACVRVIDSTGATASTALLVQYAVRLRDEGVPFEEACAAVEARKGDVGFAVACDTLENLLKGGRLTPDQANTASMLNIKPLFSFDENGVLYASGKAKGSRGVVKAYVEAIEKASAEQGRHYVRFCHVDNPSAVENVKRALAEAGVDYDDAGSASCGATVATHLGIGAFGVAYMPVGQ